jgi:hypothetical protein
MELHLLFRSSGRVDSTVSVLFFYVKIMRRELLPSQRFEGVFLVCGLYFSLDEL